MLSQKIVFGGTLLKCINYEQTHAHKSYIIIYFHIISIENHKYYLSTKIQNVQKIIYRNMTLPFYF